MESIRKWFYRPKRDDTSLLAQFFYADESLNAVACELDSFDGRQEPERCTTLVNQLRHCQDKILTICNQIMDELIPESRANRDFRVKFPDDVMQENLAGQLWFGAECLAAGSTIMNREAESSAMRPLAKALTKSLEIVRNLLREHALKGPTNLKAQNPLEPSLEKLIESLKIFDRLFADFELCYVGAMVPVKSTKEYEQQELVCVLFSETLQRALERGLLSQADVDNYEPALMFTIPRLAIVAGLLAPPGGPLCLNSPDTISEMFRPFRNLLLKIRELLWTLNNRELYMLEKLLCSNEEPSAPMSQSTKTACQDLPDVEEFVHNFFTDYPYCKDFIVNFYTVTKNTGTNMDEIANDAVQILDEENGRIDYLIERRLQPDREKRSPREKKNRSERDQVSSSTCDQDRPSNVPRESNESRISASREIGVIDGNSRTNVPVESSSRSVNVSPRNKNRPSRSDAPRKDFIYDSNEAESSAIREYAEPTETLETANANGPIDRSIREDNGSPQNRIPEDFLNPDISQILGTTDNIEIPQTQYLLNQVSHENNVTGETIHVENSLPDMDSRKLISEANKTLSSLLLDGECQNEISEQTDSGICTVISSENTSLYDKSPEEKKTFANEIHQDQDEEGSLANDEDTQENTSYSCSNLNSPKRKNSTISECSSCVCSLRAAKNIASVDAQMDVSSQTSGSGQVAKNAPRISSNFNGTNEEFVGIAYGNGQISVCDSNPPTFQINYSENWENLNLNIDASSTSKREFWRDLKCKNCPSTSQDISKIGSNIERYAQDRISARRSKELKQKKRHQRKFDRRGGKKSYEDAQRSWSCNVRGIRLPPASSESSRSNSTDRCLNPRLASFGASLHPSQNTRQMPNFGSHSPQRSPRLCHFEPRADVSAASRSHVPNSRTQGNSSPHNRKLLDHRRSRSEQIARMKRTTVDKRGERDDHGSSRPDCGNSKCGSKSPDDLVNDGLGPRTDKTGLATESPSPTSTPGCCRIENFHDEEFRRVPKPVKLMNPAMIARAAAPGLDQSLSRRGNAASSSSCSSCCDSSSETSEFQSDCQDDEEIALAMQAAEIANRNQIRAKFRSSEDLVHRLFVCIAGVADQLQTNFASDLRNILKCVFLMNSSQTVETVETKEDASDPPSSPIDAQPPDSLEIPDPGDNIERQDSLQEDDDDFEETTPTNERISPVTERGEECVERAPVWVPDNDAPRCMACQAGFTVVRRRHHCRNCGKVFCGRCSSNNVPLPRYGHTKPVRVCNRCFLYQVTPFTVSQVTPTS